MSGPLIIGCSAKAEHGKDSTFLAARKLLGEQRVVRVAFADGVREEATRLGWDGKKDERGRSLLQRVGMERRQTNPNYWIDLAFSKIRALPDEVALVFITDVRFENEADAVLDAGGLMWRIQRFNADGSGYVNSLTAEQKAHASERDLDDYPNFNTIIRAVSLENLEALVALRLEALMFSGHLRYENSNSRVSGA